jgi:AraC-like DNA-binding protein/mannose-6-phosphate isomerase-like protein (cupin superfamily)
MEQYKYSQEDDRLHVEMAQQIHLEMAGLVNCPKGWKGKLHSHPFWEFVFISSGEGEMKSNNYTCPMRKNDLFMVPPLESHQFINTGREKVENLYVGFAFDIQSPSTLEGPQRLSPLGEPLINSLRELTASFKGTRSRSGYRNQALIFDVIYRILDLIQNDTELSRNMSLDKDGIIAEKAKKYLDSNVHRTVNVADVASKFFLSPHYFSKKFKAETGLGIKEYHNQARMEMALELFKDPLLSVSDVARKLGFNNPNYFTNKFHEHFEMSPTEKRKRLAT